MNYRTASARKAILAAALLLLMTSSMFGWHGSYRGYVVNEDPLTIRIRYIHQPTFDELIGRPGLLTLTRVEIAEVEGTVLGTITPDPPPTFYARRELRYELPEVARTTLTDTTILRFWLRKENGIEAMGHVIRPTFRRAEP